MKMKGKSRHLDVVLTGKTPYFASLLADAP
jgi:hypothetical protein